jgi:hypothetical protein
VGWEGSSVVKNLPYMHTALVLIPSMEEIKNNITLALLQNILQSYGIQHSTGTKQKHRPMFCANLVLAQKQKHRIRYPKINPHIYGQVIFYKNARNI